HVTRRLVATCAYGPSQSVAESGPFSPGAPMISLRGPGMGQPSVGPNAPPAPGRGLTISQHSDWPLGGIWKVTFSVTPGGTTSGVIDPQISLARSIRGSSARNSLAGLEVRFSTVTSHDRPPCGAGPAVAGNGVGNGAGVGVGVGAGTGARLAGSDTPAGTYRSANPVAPVGQRTFGVHVWPPATSTVPSDSGMGWPESWFPHGSLS